MPKPNRFCLRRLLGLAALACLAASCGGGTATGDLDKVQVTLGRFDVSVTNTSGRALIEVVVEIGASGPGNHFVAHPDRLENGETRNIAHSSFMDRDSVPFSPRNTKATHVTVIGKDIDGKPVRVEVPFKS